MSTITSSSVGILSHYIGKNNEPVPEPVGPEVPPRSDWVILCFALQSSRQPSSHQDQTRSRPDQLRSGSLSTFGAQARIAFPGEAFSSSFAYIVELKQTFIS